jgi:hypothetical protein
MATDCAAGVGPPADALNGDSVDGVTAIAGAPSTFNVTLMVWGAFNTTPDVTGIVAE